MLHTIYFSPSGTTKTTVELLSKALDNEITPYDITVKADSINIDSTEDVVLFASPVYAGRIPPLVTERLSGIKGKGQKSVVVVLYGNRDYDDALLELCEIISNQGFNVVAAGAFIAEHCIFPKVAANRPDAEDKLRIEEFAKSVRDVITLGKLLDLNKVKGNRPYKKIVGVPIHPKVDRKQCNSCGTCTNECPTGAIGKDNPQQTDTQKCITCCRCIRVCPKDARFII